jgi:hypothetical protein
VALLYIVFEVEYWPQEDNPIDIWLQRLHPEEYSLLLIRKWIKVL